VTDVSDRPNEPPRRRWLGFGTGLLLLIASGVAYRVVAEQLNRATDSVPIPFGTLRTLDLQFGTWRGEEQRLDETLIAKTDTDDHVSRRYVEAVNHRSVSLFVAYGVRARDLLPHRPSVCYPGAGWTRESARETRLSCGDGSELPCTVFHFRRGALGEERIVVLHYYIINGAFAPDEDLLRSIAARGGSGPRYVAQIQMASAAGLDAAAAEAAVVDFALASVGPIHDLLSKAVLEAESAAGGIETP